MRRVLAAMGRRTTGWFLRLLIAALRLSLWLVPLIKARAEQG
jgi:hypothetical protein